jgi:lysophospholipase L1-like esterase
MKYKKFLLGLGVVSILMSCHQGNTTRKEPLIAKPFFLGRVDSMGRMAYPGTKAKVCFEGACNVVMHLSDSIVNSDYNPDYVGVIIDRRDTMKISLNDTTLSMPMVFEQGKHSIEVVKLTEAQVGVIQFEDFVFTSLGDDFVLRDSAYSDAPLIEFIGNSITCGYGVEDTTNLEGFRSVNQNILKTYGALVAQHYGVEALYTAYSGRGLIRNYDATDKNCIPEIYGRVFPDDSILKYDVKTYTPSVLILNIGTNDFNSEHTGKQLNDSLFIATYQSFVTYLRTIYPKSSIVCAVGPMLSDGYPEGSNSLTRCLRCVRKVVDDCNQLGDAAVWFFTFTPQSAPYGEDYHPSFYTHRRMAQELIAFLDAKGISSRLLAE